MVLLVVTCSNRRLVCSKVGTLALHRQKRMKLGNTVKPVKLLARCQREAPIKSISQSLTLEHLTKDYMAWSETQSLQQLLQRAGSLRDEKYTYISFSPKVFIPLTRLCRDSCGYCTFAQPPSSGRRAFMSLDEVLEVARLGAEQGCTEALFTLGDKPELLYPEAGTELSAMGYSSTLDYVQAAAAAVMKETGLLPHINAGTMTTEDVARLRGVSVSQGLMLESMSLRLLQPGGPHHNCPDKVPSVRISTLAAAGQACVPFTTGILIGIGETRSDRLEALLAIRELHKKYHHIQEVIIQNFRAKKGTAMVDAPEPPLKELLWTVAMARIIFGSDMNIQAPPNLTPETDDACQSDQLGNPAAAWSQLLAAGINDWGGISPLTRDWVNPEKPWPHLEALAKATAWSGKALLPRLPVYPSYALQADHWLDTAAGAASPAAATQRLMDSQGLVRGSDWVPGAVEEEQGIRTLSSTGAQVVFSNELGLQASSTVGEIPDNVGEEDAHMTESGSDKSIRSFKSSMPAIRRQNGRLWQVQVGLDGLVMGSASPPCSPAVQDMLHGVLEEGRELQLEEIEELFTARGADFTAVCQAADKLRRRVCGEDVTYVVNRNINYTNVCTYKCTFCAFSKGKAAEDLRGASYLLPLEEIAHRAVEAWERGATEVCMQGGIHPDFTGETYLEILRAVKQAVPEIHVHAFSPLEVWQGATTMGWSLHKFLAALKDAGLGSLPGTAAEVLDDEVRAVLCPDKLNTAEWVQVVQTAHEVGLHTTSTMMFGHCEGNSAASWAQHLGVLRDVQRRAATLAEGSGCITEFVPLPFVHMEAPIYLKGKARKGPTLRECVLMHAVSRLALHPHITNIQASWVKMGPHRAAQLLEAGCNDMGGSLMNESITRAAGASHGQELTPRKMEDLIRKSNKLPRQRTTLYGVPTDEQVHISLQTDPAKGQGRATAS